MCGQPICVLSQVDVWSTNKVYYPRWMCGQQICVLSHVDAWSTNMCIISGGCVVNKYAYYLRWMCGQQICELSQVDVWSTICVVSRVDV